MELLPNVPRMNQGLLSEDIHVGGGYSIRLQQFYVFSTLS